MYTDILYNAEQYILLVNEVHVLSQPNEATKLH